MPNQETNVDKWSPGARTTGRGVYAKGYGFFWEMIKMFSSYTVVMVT